MKRSLSLPRLLATGALLLVAVLSVSCGSSSNNNNGGGVNIAALADWWGKWAVVDSTYDCNGVLQNVSRDTLAFCSKSGVEDLGFQDSTFNCTVQEASTNSLKTHCTGNYTMDGCTIHLDVVVAATRSGNSAATSITLSTTPSGSCAEFPASCTLIRSHMTRISTSDTTDCSGGGGGSGNTISLKVDGVSTVLSNATVNLIAGTTLSMTAYSADFTRFVTVQAVSVSAFTARTYVYPYCFVAYTEPGVSRISGGGSEQVVVTSLDAIGKHVTGTFHGQVKAAIGGSTKEITDGVFDLPYNTVAAPKRLKSLQRAWDRALGR